MKAFFYTLLLTGVAACQQAANPDTVPAEYPDWYVLKAPTDNSIQHVWGDIDKTIIITTGYFSLHRSTDRGRTWQGVLGPLDSGITGVTQVADTLFSLDTQVNATYPQGVMKSTAVTAEYYSVDDGRTWKRYRRMHPMLDSYFVNRGASGLPLNPVIAVNGNEYLIRKYFYRDTTKLEGVFSTPGVLVNQKRRIDLPQDHILNSLHFDEKGRLYIAASDAVCGRGQDFRFCNSRGGRGVVYVSKQPLP
jgi:hypothetical protein